MKTFVVAMAVAAGFGALAGADDVAARPDRAGMATACSRTGNNCISAPLRRTPVGLELRLPGGTWIGCKRDCSRTLREETVEFWTTRDREGRGGRRR